MNIVVAMLLQAWFFVGFPLLTAVLLIRPLGSGGALLYLFLSVIWCWEVYVYFHYRFCRQEEFLFVLRSAAVTQAPVEAMLRAYWEDRPRGYGYRFWVGCLLFFVFPGYFWFHAKYCYDAKVRRVLELLEHGHALDRALAQVPGVVSREAALGISVGQYCGRQGETLSRLAERRPPAWLEVIPRFAYPVFILAVLAGAVAFMMIFLIPKYEKIFADFHMTLPEPTKVLMSASVGAFRNAWLAPVACLLLFNIFLFSSRAKWYLPFFGRIYRLQARGRFLQTLGLMMQSGRPLPEVLDHVTAAFLLPNAINGRAQLLAADIADGQPLADSLARNGLITKAMKGLIASAAKVQNLPWASRSLAMRSSAAAICSPSAWRCWYFHWPWSCVPRWWLLSPSPCSCLSPF